MARSFLTIAYGKTVTRWKTKAGWPRALPFPGGLILPSPIRRLGRGWGPRRRSPQRGTHCAACAMSPTLGRRRGSSLTTTTTMTTTMTATTSSTTTTMEAAKNSDVDRS
eukprot:2696254-Pyramimonas_sp.AAC.1